MKSRLVTKPLIISAVLSFFVLIFMFLRETGVYKITSRQSKYHYADSWLLDPKIRKAFFYDDKLVLKSLITNDVIISFDQIKSVVIKKGLFDFFLNTKFVRITTYEEVCDKLEYYYLTNTRNYQEIYDFLTARINSDSKGAPLDYEL
jgi:hypothetical protein